MILDAILRAIVEAFNMFWEVLWPLALGFILSAVVQTLVSREAVARTLGSDSPRSLFNATLLGAASSSCSYAAVAIARSLFRKGASLPGAIVFEFASTNLVFELGLILLILLGWPFLGAEFAGGVLQMEFGIDEVEVLAGAGADALGARQRSVLLSPADGFAGMARGWGS